MGKQKRMVIGVVIVAVVLCGAAFFAYWYSKGTQKQTGDDASAGRVSQEVCDAEIVQRAGALIAEQNTIDLSEVTTAIRGKAGYEDDPNCLYVLLQYNFLNNISQGNDELLASLEGVYDDSVGFSAAFNPNTLTLSDIQQRVARLKEANKLYDENAERERQFTKLMLDHAEKINE